MVSLYALSYRPLLLALVIVSTILLACNAESKKKHTYEVGEDIPFYVNNIHPYSNPTETYEYYSLPFCPPKGGLVYKKSKLGERIEGDKAVLSDYKLPFVQDVKNAKLCDHTINREQIKKFHKAISQYYYFEMIYDDLSLFGFIGTVETLYPDGRNGLESAPSIFGGRLVEGGGTNIYYLFKHLDFHIEYNGNQVIKINVTSDKVQELKDEESATITFTYSATWTKTDFPFERRRELYTDDFFSGEIHWLSIMNSVVLVILLTGFLAIIIMRVLKADYSRYARAEEEEDDQEDYGWKLIHGDVFRFPPHKNLFSSFLGIGAQFMCIIVTILFTALFGAYYPNNGGNMYTSAIVLYALTSAVSGFIGARMYKQLNGERWAWNIILTATLFGGPFFLSFAFVNSVAIYYKVTVSLPFLTILEVLAIWAFVGFPLTVLGGIGGRRVAGTFEAPCRTKNFPREIHPIQWYRRLPFQMIMAGFLPFSAIYIELFYIYSSVWGHATYTLYHILFLVFIILNIVTACITIALTYFQLSMEDHRWWWPAFINGGSTGIFIYAYSIFYYFYRSRMSGLLQASFYFSYMLCICYFFFILLGTVGFSSSLVFVRRIYRNLKSE
eukprot:TRINITY_DN4200_c0_g1_i1.p1 TRINITY_DN4200_c0_g1~~TRINITY_DN4200_c0_g1_i1.p1  ORF type:complete len:612 (-),score=94.66 TRINITY_DN4200_c0_g1_i1:182-2017(-)